MSENQLWLRCFLICAFCAVSIGCATTDAPKVKESHEMPLYMHDPDAADLPLYQGKPPYSSAFDDTPYAGRLPQTIDYASGKLLIFDPTKYAWGAYEDGVLVRGGIATGGADYCRDINEPCRTKIGEFRIYAMGDKKCFSRQFPKGKGGALMPYCMFFNKGQSFHGSPDLMMVESNVSHGCVHLRIPDAAWLRNDFVKIGTKVMILPYGNEQEIQQSKDETNAISSSDI